MRTKTNKALAILLTVMLMLTLLPTMALPVFATDWTLEDLQEALYEAEINGGGEVVIEEDDVFVIDGGEWVPEFIIPVGISLRNEGSIINNGNAVNVAGNLVNNGYIENNGMLLIGPEGMIENSGLIVNYDSVILGDIGGGCLLNNASIDNYGVITLTYGILINMGLVYNYSSVNVYVDNDYFGSVFHDGEWEGNPEDIFYLIWFYPNGGSFKEPYPNANAYWVLESETIENTYSYITPTWEGYIFKGWAYDNDGCDIYDKDVPVTSPVTLYAVWELSGSENTLYYDVTFNANGGIFSNSNDSLVLSVKEGETVADHTDYQLPTRDGFILSGWSWYVSLSGDSSDGPGLGLGKTFTFTVEEFESLSITSNRTVNAIWVPVQTDPTFEYAEATAAVEKLKGNQNELTISITEYFSDGSTKGITTTLLINNNAASVYEVGAYSVFVDTKGNTDVRKIYIVE